MPRGRRWISIGVVIILVFFLIIGWGTRLYTDWLWFKSLNYQEIFITILLSELGLRLTIGLATFILLLFNLLFTRKAIVNAAQTTKQIEEENVITLYQSPWNQYINYKRLNIAFILLSLVIAFFVSLAVTGDWVILQKFLHPNSFNVADPLFQKDIGFYVFSLPFYHFLYKVLMWLIVLVAFFTGMAYFSASAINGNTKKLFELADARYHLSVLAAIFFLVRAWGYRLQQYMLFYSEKGVVYGPGYTDVHATLLAYKILFFLALLCGIVILANIFMRRFRLVVYTIGFLVVVSIVLGGIYPAIVQRLIVVPNEMDREKPYIEDNIRFTQMAYNLDKIERRDFPAGRTLTLEDIQNNQDAVKNIRLWDYRPLQQTYRQLQEMRLYYEFKDIDVDRYVIDGQYRQVMLAARELNQSQLAEQAQTWVNQHLKFTHGYGFAMSPVNEVTSEGLPQFFVKDIPPATPTTDLKVERPEIYFGELTNNYVVVNTRSQEFDYPRGDENAWCTYQSRNGVQVNSFLRRLLFALAFGDYKLLLSGDITNESQILYYRNIWERVPKIAPFLTYDSDPYLVLGDGKLYWMWDAYTTSDMFPYSEPFKGRANYIRNAVKVVVDAYTGKVTFYIADQTDPVVRTYQQIFPSLFKQISQMPEELKNHIRYPEDLFMIQAKKYTIYHMTNYRVFYNKEDTWDLPTEMFGTEEQPMESYYTITKLPGEQKPEFIQILPFTPHNKKNMIAWMAGRSDGENYGKLLVYEFPKQELVFGPMQVEARINQDTLISEQITLWDQRGSEVIRGNLLVIPVKDALLYVEPLYLQSEQSKMPELRRVIVAHGDQVIMEPTIDLALKRIFGSQEEQVALPQVGEFKVQDLEQKKSIAQLAKEANRLYKEAENRLKEGDWAGYGNAIRELKTTLQELVNQVE